MKAAIVKEAGQLPVYGEFPAPVPMVGEDRIAVRAAAVSHLVKMRASGTHYSASGAFPFVVGIDGVGTLDSGARVYFMLPRAPYGSMAEQSVVASTHWVAVPDTLDDVTAAAIANPGMSSWAAFTERAHLRPCETVLVNGATGTSGRLAVQIAKHLGAGKIIATGRNVDSLRAVARLGADTTVALGENSSALEENLRNQFAGGVDVVIDYLWGQSAQTILAAAAKAGPESRAVRFVQVGSMSGAAIALQAAVLRSSAIEMMGSGLGSIPQERLMQAIASMLQAAAGEHWSVAAKPVPLAQFERAWREDNSEQRTVFTMARA
jgi:NADPH:quinone reductase-like Zn-dependent oxidoreductase